MVMYTPHRENGTTLLSPYLHTGGSTSAFAEVALFYE